ncbi:MAG TPA: GerMN domain-containing protein [Thermoanaerobaculia bacterium]|nr:GerMN domain-containing protein [Thermoanaerobaculia bacterium]
MNRVSVRPVTLFFETPQLLLGSEQRNLTLPENEAGALTPVLRELIRGSSNAAVPRSFPPDAVVRATYLMGDGTAIVDLGGATLVNGWSAGSHEELIATFSIVHTLTANFPSVKRVRILVNGQAAETLAGHVALDRSLTPLPSLLAAR